MKVKYNEEEAKHLFFTSDTHFWHTNAIKYCNRPFESVEQMNDVLIINWNSIVGKDDTVFHLGDFAFCGPTKIKEIKEQLNGNIILIKGNHDYNSTLKLFDEVYPQIHINIEDKSIYLNHFPFASFPENCYQLFGHLHLHKGINLKNSIALSSRQYDVGVDNNNYRPVSWSKIKEINGWSN